MHRSFETTPSRRLGLSLFSLLLCGVAACKGDAPAPAATAEGPAASSSAPPSWRERTKSSAEPPRARLDPIELRLYYVEACYFETLSLRVIRDAYLASLGGGEPGPGKVPELDAASEAALPARPGVEAPTIKTDTKRNARRCSAAAEQKLPALPEIDAARASFAPLALELAKTGDKASRYYARGEQARDQFKQGRAYHEKLVAGFAQLDEKSNALGAAIEAYRKSHPTAAVQPGDEGFVKALDEARALVLATTAKSFDAAAFRAGAGRLQQAVAALRSWAAGNPEDPRGKGLLTSLERFSTIADRAAAKATDKGVGAAAALDLPAAFGAALEARHHAQAAALARSMK